MFSGIVETTGKLKSLKKAENQWRLLVETPPGYSVKVSESVSVNGICLTVVSLNKKIITFDILNETYSKTSLQFLKPGDFINLERPLKFGDRIGGHFVTGHIDGTGEIIKLTSTGREIKMRVKYSKELSKYLTPKGSITIEGISLTLGPVKKTFFEVFLIPYTLEHTNLRKKKEGDRINLEVDLLARYARGEKARKNSEITLDFLKKHGFC